MIRPLRKYHFLLWRVFALVLPIAFTMALVLRPALKNQLRNEKDFEISFIVTDSLTTLTIEVLSPIQAASCIVYAHSADGKKFLLGNLNNTGHYVFPCFTPIVSISLYDAIREKEILNRHIKTK